MPTLRIDSLHFAAGTPYETRLTNDPHVGKRVMPSEVATAMREALSQVVDSGTAKRVSGSFKTADGTPLVMGGKTGTGDNRIEAIGSGGRILSSKSINRTATFVFYIGNNHFGTLTAFVPGVRRRTSSSPRRCRCRCSRAWRRSFHRTCSRVRIPCASPTR